MRLDDYIRTVGEERAASVLRASIRAIRSWRYGARRPGPLKALDIERATGGIVTFLDIYDPDASQKRKRKGRAA